ncbi:hypothetical protein DPEC_G00030740 [Dallia pectoralis]|uniref:Uncharacterized protein n=1 Tax=Dallia pectoralis TaxID=75939 RepID=A0ACC2HC84_DALPE|nr:hypothetical protein DPEC_G00030740 [Dallia pectoralis]
MTMGWKIAVSLLVMTSGVLCQPMPGAPKDANMNDRDVKDALRYAVSEYNKETNDYHRVLVNVVKAQEQVVAGTLYKFTVKMVKVPCDNRGENTVNHHHCNPEDSKPYLCNFDVWTQPWLNKRSFKSACEE